jgi:PleD family two-component response regulator
LGEKEDENIKDLSLEKVIKNKDKNILLIEKDRIMAQFISHILSDSYNVMIVNDKDEFKNNNPVDLVIYDLEEDYHNFLRMLRSDTRTKYVPIVAICNEGTRDNYADILSAGMTTLIEKPFHTVYFKAIIEHSFSGCITYERIFYISFCLYQSLWICENVGRC